MLHHPYHLNIQEPLEPADSTSLIDHHLYFMQEQESDYHVGLDYMSLSQTIVTPENRRIMCLWTYKIVDLCAIDREVACIAMSYLDRFMTTSSHRATHALQSRTEYQLASVSCLIIALKCRAGIMVGTDVVANNLCHGRFKRDEIETMEIDILHALNWRLNGPSSHEFVDTIVGLLPTNEQTSALINSTQTMIEAAVVEYDIALQSSSSIAIAALLATLEKTKMVDTFHSVDLLAWSNNIINSNADSCLNMGNFIDELTDIVEGLRNICRINDNRCSLPVITVILYNQLLKDSQ